MARSIFRTKTLDQIAAESGGSEYLLKRTLSTANLVALGVGATFGSGAFILLGEATGYYAGPGILISLSLSAAVILLATLCYAEFASMAPIAGSAYTYSYISIGELPAFILGWNLLLSYAALVITLSVGWSAYIVSLLGRIGITIPYRFAVSPLADNVGDVVFRSGSFGNIPAAFVVLLVSIALVRGIRESASGNVLGVLLKILITLFIIVTAWSHSRGPGLTPVIPANTGTFGEFGWSGVWVGAGFVVFMYIGADAVSTTGEEARNPRRSIPLGLIGSVAIVALLYSMLTAAVLGAVRYDRLKVANPISVVLDAMGINQALSCAIELAIVFSLTSILLIGLLGLPRLAFALSRDGLLPGLFQRIHPRYRTPHLATIPVGVSLALLASSVPLGTAARLVSLTTLVDFAIVCAGVLVLRKSVAYQIRPIRIPLAPFVAAAGFGACLFLATGLVLYDSTTAIVFLGWILAGFAVYATYGYRHSVLEVSRRT